jgi:LysM repeat protein
MRRLLPCLILSHLLLPALAHAAPPRARGRLEARADQHAAARARKQATETTSAPAADRRTPSKKPDVCTLHREQEPKSVSLRSHRIERGDSLSGIAWRYGTSVKALAAANGITEKQTIRTGQTLVIPQHARAGGGDEWLKYASPAKKRGRLDFYTLNESRFRGVVVEDGKLLPSAREEISNLLGAKGSHPQLSERLIRLLVRVSDTFGGRPLRIVSGYRSSSFFSDSRHKTSEAVDFSIPGVPNEALRQYLLLLDDVGVGYYPNSSFLHLDVRGCSMAWIDYAGPGEAPRRSPRTPARTVMASNGKRSVGTKRGDLPRASDLDDIAEEVAAAMQEAPKAPLPAPESPPSARTFGTPDPVAASLRPGSRR